MKIAEIKEKVKESRRKIKEIIMDLSNTEISMEIASLPNLSKLNFSDIMIKWSELDAELAAFLETLDEV